MREHEILWEGDYTMEQNKSKGGIIWKPDMEYIGVRIPDKMLIASLINEAKGSRTMAQLADACNVSASMLSRIVNGKITKPMAIEVIRSIAENSETQSATFFERLARANGLMPKVQFEEREALEKGSARARVEERRELETKAQNIIMTELLKRGVAVKLLNWRDAELHSSCGQSLPFDFAIETDLGEGRIVWSFMIIPYTLGDVLGESNAPVGYYLRRSMQNMSGWFLTDAWEPELLENRLHTFLFVDGSVYLSFEDTVVVGAKVNTDFSFVALGVEQENVNFEIFLRRRDGKEHELVFARKVMPGENESEDIWDASGATDDYYGTDLKGE